VRLKEAPKSALKHDPGLPNYAQPTIAFSQHTLRSNNLNSSPASRCKAGASKSNTIRPYSSKSTIGRTTISSSKTGLAPSKGLADMFYTPGKDPTQSQPQEEGYNSLGKKSPNYRAPSLVHQITADESKDADLLFIMKETESLINQITEDSDEGDFLRHLEYYKSKLEGKSNMSLAEWNDLINHHSVTVQKLQGKLRLDYKLIRNVLELNNAISFKCSGYKKEVEKTRNEISDLKSQLRTYMSIENYFNGYADVFKVANDEPHNAIFPTVESCNINVPKERTHNRTSDFLHGINKKKSFTGSDGFLIGPEIMPKDITGDNSCHTSFEVSHFDVSI
jgi:hypothetical protein